MSHYPYIDITDELRDDHAAFVEAVLWFMEKELRDAAAAVDFENMANSREAPGL